MKAKTYKNSLEELELLGPVKDVLQLSYEPVLRCGRPVPGRLMSSDNHRNVLMSFSKEGMLMIKKDFTIRGVDTQTDYTAGGRVACITNFDEDGDTTSTRTYRYNEAWNIEQMDDYEYDEFYGERHIRTEYEYDEQGYCIEQTSTWDREPSSRHTYLNDAAGNVLVECCYDKDDNLVRRIEKTYDERGDLLTYKQYDASGKLTADRAFEYNGPGGAISGYTDNDMYHPQVIYPKTTEEPELDHYGNWTEQRTHAPYWKPGDKPQRYFYRQITYYGEPCEQINLSIIKSYTMAATEHSAFPPYSGLSPEQWQWVSEGATQYEPFSIYRYYAAVHGFLPARSSIPAFDVELDTLKQHLVRHAGAVEVWWQGATDYGHYYKTYQRYVLHFPAEGYVLEAENMQHIWSGGGIYDYAGKPLDSSIELGDYVQFGELNLYFPPEGFGTRNMAFEERLFKDLRTYEVKKMEETPEIYMIAALGGTYTLKTYLIKNNFEIADLDLNYGAGFEKFHDSLMEKFSGTTQGLFLLHGEPGTGKTFYVRHLLRKMQESKKEVIYMPPNMVDRLAEPAFMTFISDQVAAFRSNGKSCIMLIEDAEPLLVARDANIRIQGITNLLNMTDGLLNDMLGMQIICTFNVPLKELDKALLRPGRLIARKEFKALPDFEANVLAHSLGITHVFKKPATLSEIYAKATDKQMLTHDE